MSGAGADRIESSTRLGFIDFAGTRAFSEEVHYFPSFWIHMAGRDPEGTVAPGRPASELKNELKKLFMSLKNPVTGERIAEHTFEREELYRGPYVERAPDLVLDLGLERGYSYGCLPSFSSGASGWIGKLPASERAGAKGGIMNGSHRRNGVFVCSGRGIRSGRRLPPVNIVDVAPTILSLFGVEVPDEVDGEIVEEAFD